MPVDANGRFRSSFELIFHFNKQWRKPNKVVSCTRTTANASGQTRQPHGGFRRWTSPAAEYKIPDSVIRIKHHAGGIGEGLDHPAVFPVALAQFIQTAYSDRHEIVYEPFCGSGSSLIAAQRCTRVARAVEIAPDYVDVALLRWCQTFPRTVPVLVATGETWPQVVERRRAEQQATQTSAPGVEC
jgi:hypothetical protein